MIWMCASGATVGPMVDNIHPAEKSNSLKGKGQCQSSYTCISYFQNKGPINKSQHTKYP